MNTTKELNQWWVQFPSELRRITICRLLASIGAGGVIYFTALVFNELSFTGTEIGLGFFVAAIAGTVARLSAGLWLDRSTSYTSPLKVAAFFAIAADLLLFTAFTHKRYLIGEFFLGAAAGFYWPSVEVAIPMCSKEGESGKGFALARSADALGVSLGALIGSFLATIDQIRLIYLVEIFCMIILIALIKYNFIDNKIIKYKNIKDNRVRINELINAKKLVKLSKLLAPILVISLLSTGILSLMQIGLQLDLEKGGINRPEISINIIGWIISYKLILLLIMQWPIGRWLSEKKVKFGLKLSNICLLIGCILLSFSSLFNEGIYIVLIALVPLTAGIAMFLPTATEAIVQVSPKEYRGLSMSLYSQCFGLSFLIFPLLAGRIIDTQGNGGLLWIIISILCILTYPLTRAVIPNDDYLIKIST